MDDDPERDVIELSRQRSKHLTNVINQKIHKEEAKTLLESGNVSQNNIVIGLITGGQMNTLKNISNTIVQREAQEKANKKAY